MLNLYPWLTEECEFGHEKPTQKRIIFLGTGFGCPVRQILVPIFKTELTQP